MGLCKKNTTLVGKKHLCVKVNTVLLEAKTQSNSQYLLPSEMHAYVEFFPNCLFQHFTVLKFIQTIFKIRVRYSTRLNH